MGCDAQRASGRVPRYHGGIIWPDQAEAADRPFRTHSRPAGSCRSLAHTRESADDPLEEPPSERVGGLCHRDTSGLEGIIDDTLGIIWAILVTYCKLAI